MSNQQRLMEIIGVYEMKYLRAKNIVEKLQADNDCYNFLERASPKDMIETYWRHYKRHTRLETDYSSEKGEC